MDCREVLLGHQVEDECMSAGNITVVEGEDTVRTYLSLQFVYRGSIVCREYGCFLSCAKPLPEIESIMSYYGMPSDELEDSPSIVMLDAARIKRINHNPSQPSSQLAPFLSLLKEIYKDIGFTRLAVDSFDLLSDGRKEDIEDFFHFTRINDIDVLLTVNLNLDDSDLLDTCDSYIIIKRGSVPLILFS